MPQAVPNRRNEVTRRGFFDRISDSTLGAALTYLLGKDVYTASCVYAEESLPGPKVYDLNAKRPHFEPRAKAVIHLFMNGGPSQMDMFDYKPVLDRYHGKSAFDRIVESDVQNIEQAGAVLRSPFKFARHGRSGKWVSEVMPHLAECVDDMAFIQSMYTTTPAHDRAVYRIQTGRMASTLPTLGAWTVYGLGTENQNLPAYVVLDDPLGLPIAGTRNWQSGYLPPVYQGTRLRSKGSPLVNLQPEVLDSPESMHLARDLLSRLDLIHKNERPGQLRLDARIATYELAGRLQLAATDALDISQEDEATRRMYGVGDQAKYTGRVHPIYGCDSYARRCLMARRLVERGVRFVQIYINSQIWDMHSDIENEMWAASEKTEKPIAALLKDLKRCGLLDSTLVVCGGEFGRLPISQFQENHHFAGRDHNPHGFTCWMAGGGVKGGTVYGATDELGYRAVENPVSVAQFHATILHLLGLHHEELFFERNGLEDKLTFTHQPRVIDEILV